MDQLKEERLQILELLKDGTITPEEAEKLLAALTSAPKSEQRSMPQNKKQPFRMLKVIVDTVDGEKVRINIPVEFARLLKNGKFGNASLDDFEIDIDSIVEMVNQGVLGELITIDTDDGNHVRIVVE